MDSVGAKIVKLCLIFFATLAVFVDCFFIYLLFTVKTETSGSTYVGTAQTIESDEKQYFLEANLYDNANLNGTWLGELQFNKYTDWKMQDMTTVGMQRLSEYKSTRATSTNKVKLLGFINLGETFTERAEIERKVSEKDFLWYEGYKDKNGNSEFHQTEKKGLTYEDEILIDIKGIVYKLKLNKFSEVNKNYIITKGVVRTYENYGSLFEYIMSAIKSNSKGYGDFILPLNLTKFFSVYKHLGEGKFDDVSKTVDNEFTNVLVKVNYEKNGANYAKQSLFKIINKDPGYNNTGTNAGEYWNFDVVVKLNNNDFKKYYSENLNGNLLSLKTDVSNYIKSLKRKTLIVEINLADEDEDIVGLNFSALANLPVQELIIRGSGNFNLLEFSLQNTNLKFLKRSAGVNMTISPLAINSTYEEVIL